MPPEDRFPTDRPVSARVWDYWLGGKNHYEVDRAAGERVARDVPAIVPAARSDRLFLGRCVRHLAGDEGVRQFLDVGTGLPTVDNTHEIAQRVAPESRVVYVDNDPLVLAHARALLAGAPEGATDYIDADVHDPGHILAEAARTLDFDRPVALMMLALLHFVTDDGEARRIVRTFTDALAPGSFVAVSHACLDVDATRAAADAWNSSGTPQLLRARTAKEIEALFDGLELLEPGVVSCPRWRPEPSPWGEPQETMPFCGVARKPLS
ncbi:SAM-dependent methyltransferase [Actinomadura algeriensis]|uniref:O-methyltransferase involved in polyketide biosynthesis n=1 Tax=Actinomadura algeriensis TaxID=1679523 RepID=A0ABR9JSX5_9ACTN|nr:SAM-dependent methyltransferase [Actinomadura algeriensis]MBE1533663.1 O-methyltransferase involved in polyketide biosynthesis [Actinomadura algeriensis]